MDAKGNIVSLPADVTDADAEAQGLTLLTNAEALMLSGMSRIERRKWAAQKDPSILTASDHAAMAAAPCNRHKLAKAPIPWLAALPKPAPLRLP
jgi:hypothetical protein